MRFWEKEFTDQAPRPLGFPVPKPDEDNPYWRNVNELAHLIAEYLRQNPVRTPESRAAILLAETTEDLLDHRDAVAVFLRQQGFEVLPSADYPRDSRAAFVSAVQRDLARSVAFAQLLGPYEGRKPPDDPTAFVVLQAAEALLLQQQRAVPIFQWRTPEVEPERIANPTYRELVSRHTVQTGGLEQFKQEILRALQRQSPPAPDQPPPAPHGGPTGPASGATRDITDLCIYVNADPVDSDIASQVSDSLTDMGVTAFLSPEPEPGQPPEQIRSAQQKLLEECNGVVLVYGQTPATWVQAQFAFTRRVVAPRLRGVWGALLDVAPQSRPPAPLRSPNLQLLECRQGLDSREARPLCRTPVSERGSPCLKCSKSRRPIPASGHLSTMRQRFFSVVSSHVDRLLEILQRTRFLAVIGPSGSGKSSLVRAGMLPALAAGWLGTGSDWRIVTLRPGDRPLRRLATGLLEPTALGEHLLSEDNHSDRLETTPALIEAELRRGPLGLVHLVADIRARTASPTNFNVLVLVDQFEEIFRYSERGAVQGDEADAFVNLLLASYRAAEASIYVAITMRTDFLGNCVRFLELPDAINRAQYLTPRLNRDQLEQAITGPGRVFGGDVAPEVVNEMINVVAGDPDQLPILQHALARMWDEAQKRQPDSPTITHADLLATGGIAGALSRHADAILEDLKSQSADFVALAAMLFRTITERGTPESGGRDTRRPVRLGAHSRQCGASMARVRTSHHSLRTRGGEFSGARPAARRRGDH